MTDLAAISRKVRARLVRMSHDAHAAHLGSALSCADILVALYFGDVLRIDPADPQDPDRDIFILSKGHAIAAQYVCLSMRGFFPEDELDTYGQPGSRLPEQPSPWCVPGIEAATGSLGHGLGIGVGMALAAKIQKSSRRVYVVLGDGECNEGSVWEAAALASRHQLDNLVAVVDANGLQGIGTCDDVTAGPLQGKWQENGWDCWDILRRNCEDAPAVLRLFTTPTTLVMGQPLCMIFNTVKGRGLPFMEDTVESHYRIPTAAEVAAAQKELAS